MKTPNLFIIGAPKTATTSIAHWLSQHPMVFMCKPKEPNYFCQDLNIYRAANTYQQYLNLFSAATSQHIIVGEASTNYLRSSYAVSAIMKSLEDVKFIVGLRNPVEIAISLHAHLVKTGKEPVKNFIEAWNLQEARNKNLSLPWGTTDPSQFNYFKCSSLGTQVSKLLQIVPKDLIHFYFYEDLCKSPQNECKALCQFLGIPFEDKGDFPALNQRLPNNRISPLIRRMFEIIKFNLFKIGINVNSTGLGDSVSNLFKFMGSTEESEEIKNFRKTLVESFTKEIGLLEELTSRDLSHWLS